uniref:Proton-coupled folate transporter n=1 Tax=Timema tahoe TaxID=61484 RepID=A0A7R9IGQ0_9NEOP|nr:unnamed protein product [Timema tahoe]
MSESRILPPLVLLCFLWFTFSGPVSVTLYLQRACRVTLNLNLTECERLDAGDRDVEVLVQPSVNLLQMAASIIESLPSAVASFFLGPWSDANGRKPLLMWPFLGYFFKFLLLLFFSEMTYLPPTYFLLASVPVALTGGFVSIISSCYSYISDVTTPETRARRMGFIQASLLSGLLMGNLVSSYLFKGAGREGYTAVYGTSALLALVGFIYITWWLPESRQVAHLKDGGIKDLFFSKHIKDMFNTCFLQRSAGKRTIVLLTIATLASSVLTIEGEFSMLFLYTRLKFGWDIRHYAIYNSVGLIMSITGILLGLWVLTSLLKLPPAPLTMLAFSTNMVAAALISWSPSSWYLYLASGVGFLSNISSPLCRAIIANSVQPHEVGKVFALTSSLEAITPLAAGPIYTLLYNSTLNYFPGALYVLSAAMFLADVILMGVVFFIQRRYTSTDENNPLIVND